MKIGISYNIKNDQSDYKNRDLPEDAFEEFDSPETIVAIRDILSNLGHEVVMLGFGRIAVEQIFENSVDFVFNLAEGFYGRSREAQMPSLFEMLNIPYSGPDPLTASITLDKIMAKKIANQAGINTPNHLLIQQGVSTDHKKICFPLILKLVWEGSSKGIRNFSRVDNAEEFEAQLDWLKKNYPGQPIIAESFVGGREFTVGVIGNKDPEILGIMEIKPKDKNIAGFVYSLEVKRNYLKEVNYFCPPILDKLIEDKIRKDALRLYREFGCRDIARFDFRLNLNLCPYFLEVNPLPGLNPVSSDIVIMAKLLGIKYDDLIKQIFSLALERYSLKYAQI